MKTFNVNGKEYKARAFDFNLMCDFEDMGISIAEMTNKPMSVIRAYFALCTGKGKEFAGKEMEKSDFFRSLIKTEEQKTTKSTSKAK